MIIAIKFISLLFAIWTTILNVSFLYSKETIPAVNFFTQAISLTTFLFIQFKLWM